MSLGQQQAILSRCGSLTSCAVGMRHEVIESQRLNMACSCPRDIRSQLLGHEEDAKNNA